MRLFLKIFLSYWLALALFIVLAILTTLAMRPTTEVSAVEALQNKFLSEALQAYQTGGKEEARRYLTSLRETQHVWVFLLTIKDKSSQDVLLPNGSTGSNAVKDTR